VSPKPLSSSLQLLLIALVQKESPGAADGNAGEKQEKKEEKVDPHHKWFKQRHS